ncbi:hypothetical protein HA466_0069210 [Hirschfeldia incana]|nr:hypothetical protein HA466_0069210 [Hirschfeldia incana]
MPIIWWDLAAHFNPDATDNNKLVVISGDIMWHDTHRVMGKKKKQSEGECMVLLLQQRLPQREVSSAAPESQTLQVPCLPQEAVYS